MIETGAKLLTTNEAAEKLEVTPHQIRWLIRNGRLPAQRVGRDYFIKVNDLRLVKDRPRGRPKGAKDSKPRKRKT
jgi:excisionase family DNA binding protein